ncbi:MAG: hypothetical protein M1358_06435 [Chloroflexi bacterium]|nr:hypothetical protein [Chloroflexota bacterium]
MGIESELFRGAQAFIRQISRLRPGESALVIADTRVEPKVITAYEEAIMSSGGTPFSLVIPYVPRKGEEGENDDLPPVAKYAMYASDVTFIICTDLYHPALRSIVTACCEHGTRVIVPSPYEPEMLASDYCTFPFEILEAIGRKQREILQQSKVFHLTCKKGSDFYASINTKGHYHVIGGSLAGAKTTRLGYPGANFTAPAVLAVPRVKGAVPGARGVLYMDEVEGRPGGVNGYVKWTIEEKGEYSWVTKIEGGPEADWEWAMINKIPHGNLFSEAMWGLHPKVGVRSNPHYLYGKHAAGIDPTRHAGVIHFAMGAPSSRTEGHIDVAAPIHTHGHMFQPTIYLDGTPIIVDGHVLALDDPEVREIASKYGDPDELLAEKP